MYDVSAQGIDECMLNIHYYCYYGVMQEVEIVSHSHSMIDSLCLLIWSMVKIQTLNDLFTNSNVNRVMYILHLLCKWVTIC